MLHFITVDEVLQASYQESLESMVKMARPRLMPESLTRYKSQLNNIRAMPNLASILGTASTTNLVATDENTEPSTTTTTTLPSTVSMVVVPDKLEAMEYKSLLDIMALEAFVSTAAAIYTADKMKKDGGWDIPANPQHNAKFVQTFAQGKFKALIEERILDQKLTMSLTSSGNFESSVTAGELHFEFLGKLFDGFNFSPAIKGQLDSVLTSIVKNLGTVKFSYETDKTDIDYVVSLYYFEEVMGSNLKVPKLRLFYLHVDQNSWKLSIGKSNVNQIKFKMHYADVICSLNLSNFTEKDRDAINNFVFGQTGLNQSSLGDLTAPIGLSSKPS